MRPPRSRTTKRRSARTKRRAAWLSEESEAWGTPGPQTLGGTTVSLSLIVPDVDAVVRRAVDEGRLTDPFGHAWVVGTVIEEVAPDEVKRRMEAWTQTNV